MLLLPAGSADSAANKHETAVAICFSTRIEIPQVAQIQVAWDIRPVFEDRTFGIRSNMRAKGQSEGEFRRSWNQPGCALTFSS